MKHTIWKWSNNKIIPSKTPFKGWVILELLNTWESVHWTSIKDYDGNKNVNFWGKMLRNFVKAHLCIKI